MALTLIAGSIKNTNIHRDNKETWVGRQKLCKGEVGGTADGLWELLRESSYFGTSGRYQLHMMFVLNATPSTYVKA